MSEPGAVANTITQSNNQGQIPYTYYPDLHVTATGTDRAPFDSTTGGVGFSGDSVVPSNKAQGPNGEKDELDGQEFEGKNIAMGQEIFSMDNLPESPYYKYYTRELSSGKEKTEQKFYSSRSLGRGMNMDNIRNGVYYSNEEADLFTMGLGFKQPNITKSEVENNELEDVRDV